MVHGKWLLVPLVCAFVAGCSSADPDAPGGSMPGETTQKSLCLMSDEKGDLDDRSYVATALRGIQQVKAELGWRVLSAEPDQRTDEAFRSKLTSLLAQRCDLVVAVSPIFGAVTTEVARANPSQLFQSLDLSPDPPLENVWGQSYAVSEATFLAGYVAASVSKTGKIGTFAGLNIPPIVEFLDGFALGIEHYNKTHGTSVELLGWDRLGRVGLFVDTFTDMSKGQQAASTLMAQGADILFPVAGAVSYAAADAALLQGSTLVIGVDVDWGEQPSYRKLVLTSVLKRLDRSVVAAASAIDTSSFTGKNHTGNLANGEVDIAPFHDASPLVPGGIQDELAALRAKIISGEIKTLP